MKLSAANTPAMNPSIRLARSRLGAVLLLFVALLYPLESFSASCQLKTAPICIDNTPCKDILDNVGNTVKVCLSTAVAPTGALVSTATCWQYNGVYDCLNQATPTYTDTCSQIKNGGNCVNYAEVSATCNPNMPLLSGGACPLFDVTYRCDTAPGNPYTETTCSSTANCVDKNGNPSFCTGPVTQEVNHSFGSMVAGQEASRQAGVYVQTGANPGETDPTKISIFKGEPNRCSEGMWGAAPNCCKPNSMGASVTNTLITQELVAQGWDVIAKQYVGSAYMYDTLLDKTVDLVTKALQAMQQVMAGVSNSATAVATTTSNVSGALTGAAAAGGGMTMVNTAAMVGGAVGGILVGDAASMLATNNGASTAWAGTVTAIGSTLGTVGGTYLASATMYAGSVMMDGASIGASLGAGSYVGGEAVAALCTPCLVGMLVASIIMSFAACTPEDAKTQLKLGAPGLCHFVGTYCNTQDGLGGCITTMQSYCCFNGRLGRIIQEGAKAQVPALGGWGSPNSPNCAGLTVAQLGQVDFSRIDLSEFTADVVALTIPDGATQATHVSNMTQSFMNANNTDPTATGGIIVTGSATQLPPPAMPTNDVSSLSNPAPALMACNVAFAVTAITADGTSTGRFDVTNCNPSAIITWTNQGNCAASPPTSMVIGNANYVSSTIDSTGKASISFTLPPSCFAVTSPSTQNVWKGMVTLSPYGTLGVINAIW